MIYKLGMNVEINKTLGSTHTFVVIDSMAEVGWGELGQGGIDSLGRELKYLYGPWQV